MSKIGYFAIALVTIIAFIVIAAPATTIWLLIGKDIEKNLPQLVIKSVQGSLWHGTSEVQFQSFPPALVSWDLSPASLLTHGQVAAVLTANAEGLDVLLEGDFSTTEHTIAMARARVSSDYINTVTLNYGLDLSGDFYLDSLNAKFTNRGFREIEGRISWAGGIVHIEMPEQIVSSKLGPLVGNLSQDGDDLLLKVTSNGKDVLEITLKPDGWATVAISYEFLELANLPLPPGSDDREEPAILLEEKIL